MYRLLIFTLPILSIFTLASSLPQFALRTNPEEQKASNNINDNWNNNNHSPNKTKVPGDSPAYYCSDLKTDTFTISRLDILPNPPKAGFYCEIRLLGTFTHPTGQNASINLNASINSQRSIVDLRTPLADLDIWQKHHRSCAPEAGPAEIWYRFPVVPGMLRDGNYSVRAEAVNADRERIFCLEGRYENLRLGGEEEEEEEEVVKPKLYTKDPHQSR